jgi:hypothetical protein
MPLLRRLATAPSAHAAADLLHDWVWQRQQQQQQDQQQHPPSAPPPLPQQLPLLPLTGADAELLLAAALERGNVALALGLYDEMALLAGGASGAAGGFGRSSSSSSSSSRNGSSSSSSSSTASTSGNIAPPSTGDGRTFPPLTLRLTTATVLGLCRAMRLPEAMRVLARVRSRGGPVSVPTGAPSSTTSYSMDDGDAAAAAMAVAAASASATAPLSDAAFGLVVRSPLPPYGPLTVVPPHEGAQAAADSASRYEFELFSGAVAAITSEALPSSGGALSGLVSAVLRRPSKAAAAVHELVVRSPSGLARTFRAASATADVPARAGERVTVVCAPQRGAPSRAPRRRLLLTPSPPGSRPGEPLEVTNHATGAVLPLVRAPPKGSSAVPGSIPGWALPLAVLLAGSDAASALVDPALPALLAAGLAATTVSALAGSTLVVPKLKQLPAGSVEVEAARQKLLAQHQGLAAKASAALAEARDDARALARLWQLQAKMEAVDGGGGVGALPAASTSSGVGGSSSSSSPGGGAALASAEPAALAASSSSSSSSSLAYGARIGRVAQARAEIESRLARRLELLDGYARVMAMIEIEIELDLRDFAELLQLQGGGGGDRGVGMAAPGSTSTSRGAFGEAAAAAAAWGGGVGEAEMARLAELEALREEWASQAEARDEVERLLS